jgi:uncharacterized protein
MKKPEQISSVVVKVVERCNLNCSYCYMYNHADQSSRRRPSVMSEELFTLLMRRIREYCDQDSERRMAITFHGGEPLLLGASRLAHYATIAREIVGDRLAHMALQTNATLITREWIDVFQEHNIYIGVSLDGPADIHDAMRVDHAGNGSHAKTVRGLMNLREAGIFAGVLCVINPAVNGRQVYDFFRSIGIERMAFLLPDITHDSKPFRYGGLGRTPVADYLIPVFDRWFEEDNPNVVIRLFWDIIKGMLGGKSSTDTFGNYAQSYVVIESDGAIQPVDTLRVCEEGMIETGLNIREHSFDDLHLGAPLLEQLVHYGLPLCQTCEECPEVKVCGGGYVAHRYSHANGFQNPSAWCQDILRLFEHIRRQIAHQCELVPSDP